MTSFARENSAAFATRETARTRTRSRLRTIGADSNRMKPALSALLGFVGLLACALLQGCQSEPTPNYATSTVTASSERVLWQVTILALEKCGFPIGARLDPSTLTATSGWLISLAPFRGKGFRAQCEVHYTPKGPRDYDVQVRVRREKNMDIVQPLDLTYAQWEPDEDDVERAGVVLQYVKSLLGNEFSVGAKKKPELK